MSLLMKLGNRLQLTRSGTNCEVDTSTSSGPGATLKDSFGFSLGAI